MYYLTLYSYLILCFSIILSINGETVYDLVIIGSGPGGLTAAIYAGRAGMKPLIICGNTVGGQLMMAQMVSNWPGHIAISGKDLMDSLMNHATQVGVQYVYDDIVRLDADQRPFLLVTRRGETIKAKAIIVATGTKQKMLLCPGEQKYWGRGITHCALCDGALYKNKNVLVVGGGNAALENALHLKKFTQQITIITAENQFTADPTIQKNIIDDPTYTIHYNCTVKEFLGNNAGVTHANLLFTKTEELKTIPINGAFIAIGSIPNIDFMPPYLLERGTQYDGVKTKIDGIFIAISTQYRQAIVSAGLGCCAVIEAMKYLGN